MKRRLVMALVCLVAAAAAVPFLGAERFAGQIREALERSLQRKVEFGKVRLHLLTGPGFSIEEVVIHEDPAIGVEPVAYVTSLEARLHWRSVFTRRFEIASLRLEEPSLNLARTSAGVWNIQRLFDSIRKRSPAAPLPGLEVRAGRINFKSGSLKSSFYVTDADFDLTPEAGGLAMTFSGEPARTDRGAEGFGRLTGRGRWRAAEGLLDADLQLDRNAISELFRLVIGRDLGLHGSVSSRAHLTGPLSNLEISGTLRLEDIHRWDLMPVRGREWPVEYKGRLDLAGQQLEVATGGGPPFSLRLRAREWLLQPQWGVSATLDGVPSAGVVEVAEHMGFALPEWLEANGAIVGVLGYSSQNGLQGQISLAGLRLGLSGTPLSVREGELLIDGRTVQFGPAALELGNHRPQIAARYNQEDGALTLQLKARALPIGELQKLMRLAPSSTGAPGWLVNCDGGTWSGSISYARNFDEDPVWDGAFEVERTSVRVPELAKPVSIARATVGLSKGRLEVNRIRGAAGGMAFSGDYRRLENGARPERLQVTIPQAEAAALEGLLEPTLVRRQGIIARALGRVPPPPAWLVARKLEGAIRIGRLEFPGHALEEVAARIAWDGPNVDLMGLEGRYRGASISGFLAVGLSGPGPRYRFSGRAEQVPWREAEFDVEGTVDTEGTGAELWLNVASEGTVEARGLEIGSDEVKSMAGNYQFGTVRGVPRVQVSNLELTVGQETYRGRGGSQADGRLLFELAAGRQKMRLGGSLTPLQFEVSR
ncbi:MAG: AsmA family protein [Bryobacteraceae bacterium]|nr:AsmA family protein [Bryobacteraceae bacterium]